MSGIFQQRETAFPAKFFHQTYILADAEIMYHQEYLTCLNKSRLFLEPLPIGLQIEIDWIEPYLGADGYQRSAYFPANITQSNI